ncbi:MAG: hypothetical protein IRZ16_01145 [Myxococcaceae bacterium]|nr:hypothetical protein [Myxococcaceae bacterium]
MPGPHKGAFAIRANFNGSSLAAPSTSSSVPASPSATFGFRYMGTDSVAVDFDVGLGLGIASNFAFGFGAGFGVTAFLGSADKPIRPLVTGSFLFGKGVSTRGDDFTLGINVGGGAEYWFNDHFSLDGKLLVGLPLNFRAMDVITLGTFMPGVGANFYF